MTISKEELNVIVYHSPCIDGTAAAFAAYSFNPNYEFIGWNLNTTATIFDHYQNTTIGFFDCAPSLEMYNQLLERNNRVLVVDHHVGNQRSFENNPNCIFDMTQSGCMLAWSYFFPTQALPKLLWHIGKRDLWDFTDPDTRLIGYGIIDNPSIDYKTLGMQDINELKSIGEEKQAKLSHKISLMEPRIVQLDGNSIAVADIGTWDFSSECAEWLYDTYKDVPYVIVYFKLSDGKFKLSFRTNKTDQDLSLIAAKYGGGGHAKSAGATVDHLPFS